MSIWFLLFLSFLPGIISSAVVTLDSITIYNPHEWLATSKPIVYFSCQGENRTKLPDVKEVNISYTFKGEESWQASSAKGVDSTSRTVLNDDVFDVWELCPLDFQDSDGKYRRIKMNEFDATFFCPFCVPLAAGSVSAVSGTHGKGKGFHIAVVILISTLVSTVLIFGILLVYRYWQKKKRERDQARFLKLYLKMEMASRMN